MKKRTRGLALLLAALMLSLSVGGYIASGITAGSGDDPLISLSYLNDVFMKQVEKKIDDKVGSGTGTGGTSAFTAVQVYAGQKILGNAGTEIILRTGNAKAICPGENGLTDITDGLDLWGGAAIAPNHVYIIPRKDGRGIAMIDNGFIMVKGGYEVN
jgi:hypothetical protein